MTRGQTPGAEPPNWTQPGAPTWTIVCHPCRRPRVRSAAAACAYLRLLAVPVRDGVAALEVPPVLRRPGADLVAVRIERRAWPQRREDRDPGRRVPAVRERVRA